MGRAHDTTAEAHEAQLRAWRNLGPERRLALAISMSDDAREVAMQGVRQRHPEYTAEEALHALLRVTLGDGPYRAAWPDRPLLEP